MSRNDLIEVYISHFQIEFNFCNVKQYAGLFDSQSHDIDKINFNLNVSMNTVNLAKAVAIKSRSLFQYYSFRSQIEQKLK